MASDELDATDHVHALADAGAISTAIADRLDDNGFETIADLLIADQGDLTEVPYVGSQRADEILWAVDDLMSPPEPRDVDLEATESVVSEAAIPMSVRQGEAVLTNGASGSNSVYHTRACPQVKRYDLVERQTTWVERRDLDECQLCADPDLSVKHGRKARQACDTDTDSLTSDPVSDALEVGLGEKVELVTGDGKMWSDPLCVIDVDEPVSWEAPLGEDFETRTLTVRVNPNSGKEYDIIVSDETVWIAGEYNSQPYQRLWRVEQLNPVGRVATSTYYQLVGKQRDQNEARPEGDDTWRKYQRGETA